MYLDVTFKDGTVSHCVLTASHTIQIVNPLAQIQDAFSLDGVASVALNLAGDPAKTDPTPPDFSGAAEGATVDPTVESPATGTSDASSPDTSSTEAAADPTPEAAQTSDTPSDSGTEATPPGDEAPPPDA